MKKLKRPLSILIAALMLVSVMVIAPVTASATITASGLFGGYEYWVSPESDVITDAYDGHYNLYRFQKSSLLGNFKFVRLNPNGEQENPSWDNKWNQTYDHTPTAVNTCLLTSYGEGDKINHYWKPENENYYETGEYDSSNYIYLKVHKRSDYSYDENGYSISANFEDGNPKWYAFCWNNLYYELDDQGVLTISGSDSTRGYENSSQLPWASNLNSIKSIVVAEGVTGIGANVLSGCPNLESISIASSVRYIDPAAMDSTAVQALENGNMSRDTDDPMKNYGPASTKKLETLGVQERAVNGDPAFRFVTIADSALLKAADDYGYILSTTGMGQDEAMSAITDSNFVVGGSNNKVYSCKNTSNNFVGNYGSSNLNETRYKYISCIVTGAPTNAVVMSRFYITIDGTTYTYAPYSTYKGCAYALLS